jgi:hypothetical protein
MNTDKLYQRIGEFVVSFQWLENRLREIGWLILDPDRNEWPPRTLRNLTNNDLVNEVESLYVGLIEGLDVEGKDAQKADFRSLMSSCHDMRRYRNNLLHSAYIELKAGDDVMGILRSNPKLRVDPSSGEVLFDQEMLSEEAILNEMGKLAELAFRLNVHYTQLIHWAPFDRLRK